jgi:transcriptional accessory protein Tex/SPT6
MTTHYVVKEGVHGKHCNICCMLFSCAVQPLLVRQVRSELTRKAEHAAVEVFATNLKKLLLSPPLRGKTVVGIDPGEVHFLVACS